jgi:hypothetical protein
MFRISHQLPVIMLTRRLLSRLCAWPPARAPIQQNDAVSPKFYVPRTVLLAAMLPSKPLSIGSHQAPLPSSRVSR